MSLISFKKSLGAVIAAAAMLASTGPWVPLARADGCTFILGFQTLKDVIPSMVGTCVDNQSFAANGDAVQRTTGGLLVWRKSDNWTAFTNGYYTWIDGPYGLVRRLNTERFWWEANPDHLLVIGPRGYVTQFVAPAPAPTPTPTPAPSNSSSGWQAPVQGQPSFQAGSAAGFYIWHEHTAHDYWHLVTTDPRGVSHVYSGTITTDGTFTHVEGVALEHVDSLQLTAPNAITFTFHTRSGIDGLQFTVHGGSQLTFSLSVDGQPAPTNQIYLGPASTNPASDPFTFTHS